MQPKPSIFKKMIKDIRKHHKQQSSFPPAVKIDYHQTQRNTEIINDNKMDQQQNEKVNQVDKKPDEKLHQINKNRIDGLLKSGLEQQHASDLESIHEENWKKIKGMSKQQIESYKQLLEMELPAGFIKKLKIAKQATKKQQQYKEQKNQYKNQKEQDENINTYETTPNDNEAINKNQEIGCLNRLYINIKTKQLAYIINKQHELIFNTNQQSKQWLQFSQIKLMIQSQNNQTSIVGSQLFMNSLKHLKYYQQKISLRINHSPLYIFNGGNTHLYGYQIFQDLCKHIIPSILFKIRSTRFKSCWMQMHYTLFYFITQFQATFISYQKFKYIGCTLNKLIGKIDRLGTIQKQKQNLRQFIQKHLGNNQYQKLLKFMQQTVIKKLHAMIAPHQQKMESQQISFNIYDSQCIKKYVNDIRHKILMIHQNQLNLAYYLQSLQKTLQEHGQCSNLLALIVAQQTIDEESQQHTQYIYMTFIQELQYQIHLYFLMFQQQLDSKMINRLINILFRLCVEIKYSESTHKYTQSHLKQLLNIVKNLLWNILRIIDNEKIFTQQYSIETKFKYLFTLKMLNVEIFNKSLPQINSPFKKIASKNIQVFTLLTLSQNISNILENCETQQELILKNSLESTLDFIASQLQDVQNHGFNIFTVQFMHLIFFDLLEVFKIGSTQKNSLNQVLIDKCMSNLCQFLSSHKLQLHKFWKILTVQKIKEIVQIYNYDSFGNYPFTRTILFLTALSNTYNQFQKQLLFLQEILVRYPYLFYYAIKHQSQYGQPQIYTMIKQKEQPFSGTELILQNQIQTEKQVIWQSLRVKQKVKENRGWNQSEQNFFIRYLTKDKIVRS